MSEGTCEFSVVITTHNKGLFLRQTIESVLSQTFRDFEVIVVDHGSTDNTKEIVASFSDKRIRYVYETNCGLSACPRNKGMGLARGNLIAFLDGDDFWYKDKLRKCKTAFDDMPDIGVVCHNLAIMHDGKIIRNASFGPYTEGLYRRLLFEGSCVGTSAVVIRSSIFYKDGYRFSEDRNFFAAEDYEYWLRLAQRYRFYLISDVLGCYRVVDNGLMMGNIDADTVNVLRILDSHFAALDAGNRAIRKMIKKRRSSVMCGAGRMYNHKRNFNEARRWYVKALGEYPANYKAYIGVIAALLRFRLGFK